MHLKTITIAGFRCFGSEPVQFCLSKEMTAVVGSNASGKTALLHALSKVFGISRTQRMVHRSDFHLPPSANPKDKSPRSMLIEVVIELPELLDETATPETVAPVFRHMMIENSKTPPVCRIRLEARWDDDGTIAGEVSQNLYWVDSLDSEPKDEQKQQILASDRGLIQFIYTPASRDPDAQIRATTGALAARLMRAIQWSKETQDTVEEATNSLSDAFENEPAIKEINKVFQKRWSELYDELEDIDPKLSLISRQFDEVVSRLAVVFQEGPEGFERGLEELSDGQRSLFYFALITATYALERQVVAEEIEGFRIVELRIPALTIYALEEPENHLSPYYLARIIEQVRSVTKEGGAQAIITSHSPSVLGRILPEEVLFCHRSKETRTSTVTSVKMPSGKQEAAKFVRGAMQAFPELYFARFVLLVEGDSERIVLPRLAKALNFLIDPSFVAVVPLGGRHVQHFWHLLTQLKIPYATLLDLDLGRKGGGFGRVKAVIKQLLKHDVPREKLLQIEDDGVLSNEELKGMHKWQEPSDVENLIPWVTDMRKFGVFFSSPLDFDLMMLEAFPDAYGALVPRRGGPKKSVDSAADTILGQNAPGLTLYQNLFTSYVDHLPSYQYHFLTRSKPATHMAAISHLKDEEVISHLPEPIEAILQHVVDNLTRD